MKYLITNFFNTLKRYKLSSALNILGMGVAFATFYIILTQVGYNFSFNQKLKDVERIFLITTPDSYEAEKRNSFISRPMGEKLISCSPVVEAGGTASISVGLSSAGECYYIGEVNHRRPLRRHINFVSKGFINTFRFEAIHGTFDDLSKPFALGVSETIAEEYGLEVGDIVYGSPTAEEGGEIVVIYKDFQKNSNLAFLEMFMDIGDGNIDNYSEWSYPYYVKLTNSEDKGAFEATAKEAIRQEYSQLSDEEFEDLWKKDMEITLIPCRDLYYSDELESYSGLSKFGNLHSDIILLSVAIIIILIALINFLNFFFALVPVRVRSVNTYKIYGVQRSTLIANFIGESLGLMILSMVVGTLIAILFGKYFATNLSLTSIMVVDNITSLTITIVLAISVGVIGALYPAMYITSFTPALAIKGSFSSTSSGKRLRSILLVIQFVISISLIICSIFLRLQYNFLLHHDLGFDREDIVAGSMPPAVSWGGSKNSTFEELLRQNPDIKDITWSYGDLVLNSRMSWGRDYNGEVRHFQCYPVASNFLDVMGIEISQGRNFTKGDEKSVNGVIIFNEKAQEEFGLRLDQIWGHQGMSEIAGFCSDFHFRPLRYGDTPFAFYVYGQNPWHTILQKMYIRTSEGANPFEVIKFVHQTAVSILPDINHDDIELTTLENELSELYSSEKGINLMIMLFTIVSIIISLMGVFGLVLFETQYRAKEIAIRRVLGASMGSILSLFNQKFLKIVFICFVLSIPICSIIMHNYLKNFAYHINILSCCWVFLLALALVLAATLIVINVGCFKSATTNPVNNLKNE